MSYILDALRKSEQQRQREIAPVARLGQVAEPAPKRSRLSLNLILALLLLIAGIAIGWLRPWQTSTPTMQDRAKKPQLAPPITAAPPESARLPAPHIAETAVASPRIMEEPARPHAESKPEIKPSAKPPALPSDHGNLQAAAPEQHVLNLDELPVSVQREIPQLTLAMHSYSNNPNDSIVMINNQLLRDGAVIAPGLRLERITPYGIVIDYKGYRISRPLH